MYRILLHIVHLYSQAGPIERVRIPKDKQTKRPKPFAFVHYEYEESVPYAIDLFCDTRLFGQSIKLQNRSTGAGITTPQRNRNTNERQDSYPDNNRNQSINRNSFHERQTFQRQNSSPHVNLEQLQAQNMMNHQDFQPWQYNPIMVPPVQFGNMYMNSLGPPAMVPMPNPAGLDLNNGYIPPFLPPPPGTSTPNNSEFQGHNRSDDRGRRHDRNHSNYDRQDDRNRNRDGGSRSNDRSRSRNYDHRDRRR